MTEIRAVLEAWRYVKERFDDLLVEERDRSRTTFLYLRMSDVQEVIRDGEAQFAALATASPEPERDPRQRKGVVGGPAVADHFAASPEPERLGDPTCPETHVDGRCIRCGDLTRPAPAAPTAEALRDRRCRRRPEARQRGDGPGDGEEGGDSVSGYPNVPGCTCDRDDDSWVGEDMDMPMCDYHEKRLRPLSWESLACLVIDYEAALAVVGPRLPMGQEGRA